MKLHRKGLWPVLQLIVSVAIGLSAGGCHKHKPAAQPHPVPVIAAEVLVRDQPIFVEFIGQTRGWRDVDVRARVEGFLDEVLFSEGMPVTNGTLLYTIDDRPFKAAVDEAQGAVAQAKALWDKSVQDTNRLGRLWANNAVSRQQYDDSLTSERNAAAMLQSAQANADSAQIRLGYTRIYSPIDGLVGKNEVSQGNLVGRGVSTLLTTISIIDPIAVRFSISEQQWLEWMRNRPKEAQRRESEREIFEMILADGTVHPRRGSVTFADRQVDDKTGTLLLQVSFPNPEKLVRPGQFVRVRFPVTIVTNAVLVPQRSVTELQATYSVFVAAPDNKAEFRKVTPGPRVGNFYLISEGLKPGEKVIIEGIQKVQNNSPIAPTFTNLPVNASKLATTSL